MMTDIPTNIQDFVGDASIPLVTRIEAMNAWLDAFAAKVKSGEYELTVEDRAAVIELREALEMVTKVLDD